MRRYPAFHLPNLCLFHLYPNRLASSATLMRLNVIGWTIAAVLLAAAPAAAQGSTSPTIASPGPGQVLQGQVAVTGTTEVPNFASAELDFEYATDPTNTRFVIQTMTDPIQNGPLATWDTTTISDGDYLLLLRVYVADGTNQDTTVAVKVRNYTALPTATPTPLPTKPALQIPTAIVLAPTMTPTLAPLPTPTNLPPNPASTNANNIYSEFWRGGLIVLLLFCLFGIVIRLRRS
jgi:hypothetical protein